MNFFIRNFRTIFIVALVAFLAGTFKRVYESKFGPMPMWFYLVLVTILIVVYYLIFVLPTKRLKKKIIEANRVLNTEHDAEKYVEMMSALRTERRGAFKSQRNLNQMIIDINYGIGCIHVGRTDETVKVFSKIDVTDFQPLTKATFYCNYIYALFRQKKRKEACQMIENHISVLEKYQDVENIGSLIYIDYALEASFEKNFDDIDIYMEKAEELATGYYEKLEVNRVRKILSQTGVNKQEK